MANGNSYLVTQFELTNGEPCYASRNIDRMSHYQEYHADATDIELFLNLLDLLVHCLLLPRRLS